MIGLKRGADSIDVDEGMTRRSITSRAVIRSKIHSVTSRIQDDISPARFTDFYDSTSYIRDEMRNAINFRFLIIVHDGRNVFVYSLALKAFIERIGMLQR
jgi:hypothetical protein